MGALQPSLPTPYAASPKCGTRQLLTGVQLWRPDVRHRCLQGGAWLEGEILVKLPWPQAGYILLVAHRIIVATVLWMTASFVQRTDTLCLGWIAALNVKDVIVVSCCRFAHRCGGSGGGNSSSSHSSSSHSSSNSGSSSNTKNVSNSGSSSNNCSSGRHASGGSPRSEGDGARGAGGSMGGSISVLQVRKNGVNTVMSN